MAHIAYMLGRFPVLSETFIGNEIRAVEQLGHRVFPIALHQSDGAIQPEDASLAKRTLYFSAIDSDEAARLLRLYKDRLHHIEAFVSTQTTEPPDVLTIHAAQLAEYITKQGCCRIHAHFGWGAATYAIAAAKLAGVPVSFTCHGSDVYVNPQDLALKCKTADMVVGVAPTITKDLQKLAQGTPCYTVHCGVNTNRFLPKNNRSHARWLYAGRLVDCKGVDDILAAWKALPCNQRPPLDIVGGGPLHDSLQAYVTQHRLDDSIALLGPKDSAWLAEYGPHYRAFIAAYKHGSDGSKDTSPMVLKEAMAMALPIVTTQFIDITEMVGGECALLCCPADAAGLTEAIITMQDATDKVRARMGAAGRKRVQQYFSLEKQAEALTTHWGVYAST